ncbi:MAG: phosphoribosylamine--glycine ligase [Alphaproteobacteria bacterium]|nr:phosphoribosylamine--glycine ligase [Alphaproteobacteria bacterium]
MKILLIGSGGREHALAWKIEQSDSCETLYCAPGNLGIAEIAECVPIGVDKIDQIVNFVTEKSIDLVVVGPENPLVEGLADKLADKNIPVFGPSQKAAELEGSKGFMKDLCAKYKIKTAKYGRFTDVNAAKDFIANTGAPIVVKTDGLAAGKGVIICETTVEAEKAAEEMVSGVRFGSAGHEIVIEEFLEGEEVSFFALADGKTILPLTSAQDHKRVGDGDTGLNTGGMGAYSPAHFMTDELEQQIINDIIQPTIDGMAAEGRPFTGVLFAGIMVKDGVPTLLEHNVRFGDPECQAIMMRMEGDLAQILLAAAQGRLADIKDDVRWNPKPAMCVVMAAKGYPGSYEKNTVIKGIDQANQVNGVTVFHAGTTKGENGEILSVGGRVLGVTAIGTTIADAQAKAYEAVDKIDWPEGFCRRDIGWRALKAESEAA